MSAKYQDDEIIVRQAKREDMAEVAKMIQELADFEKMPDGPKLTIKDLERDCFDLQPPAFRCKVAEAGGGGAGPALGYALYFPTYSTWEGRALMLEDLFVRAGARRRGLGGRLLGAVAAEAAALGSRLDFHVLAWNPARAFYESKGAVDLTELEDWRYYRLRGRALRRAAAGASGRGASAAGASDADAGGQ